MNYSRFFRVQGLFVVFAAAVSPLGATAQPTMQVAQTQTPKAVKKGSRAGLKQKISKTASRRGNKTVLDDYEQRETAKGGRRAQAAKGLKIRAIAATEKLPEGAAADLDVIIEKLESLDDVVIAQLAALGLQLSQEQRLKLIDVATRNQLTAGDIARAVNATQESFDNGASPDDLFNIFYKVLSSVNRPVQPNYSR